MPKIAPEIIIPDYGFEYRAGLPDALLNQSLDMLFTRYRCAFSEELELVEIPPCFAFGVIDKPFVGAIWLRKIRHAQIKNAIKQKRQRNFIFPVCNIGLEHGFVIDELQGNLETLGGEIQRIDGSRIIKKLYNLYKNLYEIAYYRYMVDKEKNPMSLRVIKYRATYNNRLVWRWEYGAKLLGIKVKGEGFLNSLVR